LEVNKNAIINHRLTFSGKVAFYSGKLLLMVGFNCFLMAQQRNDLYARFEKINQWMPDFSRRTADFCSTDRMTSSHPFCSITKLLKASQGFTL